MSQRQPGRSELANRTHSTTNRCSACPGLGKTFGGLRALEGIDVAASARGEVVGLVGDNGAGKVDARCAASAGVLRARCG